MKIIGIIGGIGPETTVIYYRLLIGAGHTRIVVNSVDSTVLVPLVLRQDINAMANVLAVEVERLAASGADLGLVAANTPHLCFAEIQERSRIPLVSIVDAVVDHVVRNAWRRVALLGTRVTMEARFYPEAFERRDVEVVIPQEDERHFVQEKYMGELFKGLIVSETRQRLLTIIESMKSRHGMDAVILGGTELSLILTEPSHAGVTLVDTTRVHVDAILAQAKE